LLAWASHPKQTAQAKGSCYPGIQFRLSPLVLLTKLCLPGIADKTWLLKESSTLTLVAVRDEADPMDVDLDQELGPLPRQAIPVTSISPTT
jgi:hypothetical protein